MSGVTFHFKQMTLFPFLVVSHHFQKEPGYNVEGWQLIWALHNVVPANFLNKQPETMVVL